jgi:hypothetical protein
MLSGMELRDENYTLSDRHATVSEGRHLLHALEIYFYHGNLKDWERKHLWQIS